MNRPIKYRVWDKHKKQMFYSEQTISGANGYISIVEIYTGYEDADEWKNYIFSEFTGLHDKNGKEIYEGDVCKYFDNDAHIVEWIDKEARFLLNTQKTYLQYLLFDSEIEIIGNIYENPELLK